ncbi:LpqB family beta-propeller domain-containing protein [Microlunatus sp. Gsoil 973]|uniref:LpqB family beta-propeller domain-containing protein n=1 Tax=Microlunatus sp. Gsoil 973 TaxID=2672569 RepID=UPI0012B49928|nr:LpqB family beta-propeller domain-containing protein [Microlunatus sp. Gsoil 973]QGN32137.1 hypothetical protein GJV80_04290 [Microlunatus sp. Gsoil 973]
MIDKSSRRRQWPAMIIGPLLVALALTGCVSVPTTGSVEQADTGTRRGNNRPEVVPKPPVQNASPRVIIDGFLLAMSRYQPGYQIAKQFLTADARARWRPEDKITIYNNPKYDSTESNVVLSMSRVGEVGADGSYSTRSGELTQDFAMQKDAKGQWRISNPPDGLLISDTSFSATYASYNLYFFDPQFRTLVPDPIYLPTDGQTATALVQALLRGPTASLRPAVTSAFPRTSLSSVPIVDGLAQISLGNPATSLKDEQLSQMAAQIAWTLSQIDDSGPRGFRLTVNGTTLRVPGQVGSGESAYVPISYGARFAPVPDRSGDDLLGVQNNTVVAVRGDGSQIAPVSGPLGRKGFRISSIAANASVKMLAAVTDDRQILRTQLSGGNSVRTLLYDQRALLRPDFTRFDELWAVSGPPRGQVIRVFNGTSTKPTRVESRWLKKVRMINFRISPDGTRMAVIVQSGNRDLLAVAPIIRGDSIRLGDLRIIDLADTDATQIERLADLGWISSTRLLILGATTEGASFEPYGVEIDGSQFERVGTSDNWGATSLATAADRSGAYHAVVSGKGAKSWIYRSGDQWNLFAGSLSAATYPG